MRVNRNLYDVIVIIDLHKIKTELPAYLRLSDRKSLNNDKTKHRN